MAETIFTKIIRGDVPSHKIYEDDTVFSFLDVGPLSQGHLLVVPKEPAATLDKLSDESAAAIGRILPRLCRAVLQATGATAYNVLQNNGAAAHQAVFHVHFHVIPKFENRPEGGGLGITWKPQKLEPEQGKQLADRIRAALP